MKNPLLPRRTFKKGLSRPVLRMIAVAIAFALATPYMSLAVSPRGEAAARAFSLPLVAAPSITPPWDPFFANQTTVADLGVATRPFGVAAGDYDGDGKVDLVVGRTTGNVAFVKGNGDGTFAAPVVFAWKQAFFNAWSFAAADVNGDGNLDVVWGANAASTGCLISGCSLPTTFVNDGDVRVFYGNGNGTFQENTYFVSGVRHNAGSILANIGVDAGSVTAGDVDGDGDGDVVAGASGVVRLLRNNGGGSFVAETLINQTTDCTSACTGVYFPAISTQNSPWGLTLGDADGDGDGDLFVGDRALYVYLYLNNGAGAFTLKTGNAGVPSTRTNAYLAHETFRAAVGYTPSLSSGDVNGDGRADLALGLHSGTQTPASNNVANDGHVLLDVSTATGHTGFGSLADVGTAARGVRVVDVNGDEALDIIAAEYDGKIKLLRQLPPIDSDGDSVSDYVDNAPQQPNRARLDMNTDGATNHRDQLDNDFDTALGNPEDASTWQRLGDPADPDDDNDTIDDTSDNCLFVANNGQENADGDQVGDACDPLDNRDPDGDGVPTGPPPGDPLYEQHRAAKLKWSSGATKFVLRIDALSRFFQNEFTQLMTDASILSPEEWAVKCWENYDPGDIPGDSSYEPCGDDATKTLTLAGGRQVPISLVIIPKQLWTDPPVVAWINGRISNQLLEIGQHGAYHPNNIPFSDWKDDPSRNWLQCETCGLTEAEVFQLLKVGHDTLLGNYGNKWVAESGATASSPKIDWTNAAHPLLSYAAPFNASDETARKAMSQLGFKAFSASVHEENGSTSYGANFTSAGVNRHETFGPEGMFHVSADLQVDPPEFDDDDYNEAERQAYENYLQSVTQVGGLNTWLIEEVEWSGRLCNNQERLGRDGKLTKCGDVDNRENNTVYGPRWEAWLQLLDYVKDHPDSVVMTMDEVALAKGFDNSPTVYNPDQADSDHDGVGDVIDGASVSANDADLSRNQPGSLSATLTNGGTAIAGQTITFSFDADGDATTETFTGTTDSNGTATVSVTATRPVGAATYEASWDGGLGVTSIDSGAVTVRDATNITLDGDNPAGGQVTDPATFGATLTDSNGNAIEGQTITVTVGSATGSGTTDDSGHAEVTLTLAGPAGSYNIQAGFAGAGLYGASSATAPFALTKEDTALSLSDAVANKNSHAVASAGLKEADGAPLAGETVEFYVQGKVKGSVVYTLIGTAATGTNGIASFEIPMKYVLKSKTPIRAVFAGGDSFARSSADAFTYRQ